MRRFTFPLLALLASAFLPGSAFALTTSCGTNVNGEPTCTYTRALDVWYGTLTVAGAPLPAQDFLELTDHIMGTAAGEIFNDPAVDPRAKVLGPWVNAQTDIDWVLAASENLPAQQNLLNDFAAAGTGLDTLYGPGLLSVAPLPTPAGTATYNLVNWTIQFDCGNGNTCFQDNIGNAQVSYFNLDALWTAPRAESVPEPGTLALLGVGVAGLAWRRRNTARRIK